MFNLKKSNSVQNIFTTWKLICIQRYAVQQQALAKRLLKKNYTEKAANTKKMQKQVAGKLMGGFGL